MFSEAAVYTVTCGHLLIQHMRQCPAMRFVFFNFETAGGIPQLLHRHSHYRIHTQNGCLPIMYV
jgi:hypothetical protein